MSDKEEKYKRVIKLLREAKPDPGNTELITEMVMAGIRHEKRGLSLADRLYEFFFGWVYIGWMRRSMVAAAVCLMIFFGYQQFLILKRVETLSGRSVVGPEVFRTGASGTLSSRVKMYTLLGKRSRSSDTGISEKDIDRFIESVNDLQVRYGNIMELIEKDPQMKKYFEERIGKIESKKPKI